ncbi:hypothetical protein CH286_25545 [Rhodococcus sp. WWJCD1]|uniref:putative quinol monooxygenase n=1 Tax=unclassified Rhodococcus (in: high G+C Gram-positive bacteria) TaxID=192944 RepID=UPI000B9A53A9|nr:MULTISPECIES: putative quinol monooxygenase [unclassified Rhodococcus (in: high G+C Gram-positive bacteria)]OZC42525.1 hypothetical protein CH286_25545 [Rhodococcus sp. WWJCD1]OZE89247.1 hypothetical protein CH302_28055 [Rhodococcus sp. 15-2388-1-1a]
MPFTVFVTLDVRPEHLEKFVEAVTVNARASLQDESGCLTFDVHRDAAIDTRFHLYEIYADEHAFRVTHRSAPHYARWQEAAAKYVVAGGHRNTFAVPMLLGTIETH